MAKANEDAGVSYKFLDGSAPTPNYNLTLMRIDESLVEELRGPTTWLEELNLSDWIVILETTATGQGHRLLVSDAEAVREWALDAETGSYTQYDAIAKADSWLDPDTDGPLAQYLLK
jgi:hypothetical protein